MASSTPSTSQAARKADVDPVDIGDDVTKEKQDQLPGDFEHNFAILRRSKQMCFV
jgi:hypothetical protein